MASFYFFKAGRLIVSQLDNEKYGSVSFVCSVFE